jgi:hypothetical protein
MMEFHDSKFTLNYIFVGKFNTTLWNNEKRGGTQFSETPVGSVCKIL